MQIWNQCSRIIQTRLTFMKTTEIFIRNFYKKFFYKKFPLVLLNVILYADDLVLMSESLDDLRERFQR